MSTSSIPRSYKLTNNVTCEQFASDSRHKKYATLEKCNSLFQLNENATRSNANSKQTVNFDWYKQLRCSARTLMKSKSDASQKARTMQCTNKSVNRNGTIARNHFRGVPGDFLDKQTKHFLLSMTVSIQFLICSL